MGHLLKTLASQVLFREVTIQRLLKMMGLLLVVATIAFAAIIIMSNHFIVVKQEKLIRVAIPVNTINQRLNNLAVDHISRITGIESARTLSEIEMYDENSKVKQAFRKELEALEQLVNADNQDIVSDLHKAYDNFIQRKNQVTELYKKKVAISSKIQRNMLSLKSIVDEVKTSVGGVSGILNLRASRQSRKLNQLFRLYDRQELTASQLVPEIQNSLDSREYHVQRAGYDIWGAIDELIILFYRITDENSRDDLINFRENLVPFQVKQIESALRKLKLSISKSPEVYTRVQSLENKVDRFITRLITNQDSVYHLQDRILSLDKTLSGEKKHLTDSFESLQSGLDRLSMITEDISSRAVSDTRSITRHVLKIIIIVCFITLVVAVSSVIFLMLRINHPLQLIHDAMAELSRGKLATRLNTEGLAEDEFLDLAKDFNRFVESNQEMIHKLSQAQKELAESESRISAILENAQVGIVHFNDRHFLSVNHKFEEMLGYSREELLGNLSSMIYADQETYERIGVEGYEKLRKDGHYEGEWKVKRKDGHIFLCNLSAKLVDSNDSDKGSIWLYKDISERKSNENKLRYLANYDVLTKLPNRTYFQSQLEKDIKFAENNGTELAVLFIDLDRFKQVNDSLGHDAGDRLLQDIALRLMRCVRGSDSVARLGGDEFTITVTNLTDYSAIETVAKKILKLLQDPVMLEGEYIAVSPSIGISIFPNHGTTVTELVRNADAAMYHAKKMGRNNFQYYFEEMNSKSHEMLAMENRLRGALENNEFLLYYQPQVDTETFKVIGYEALIRWKNDELGLVSPGHFIPLLEESGMIIPVGEWVLRTACEQAHEWQLRGRDNIKISVNLSAKQFQQQNLVDVIADILEETEIEPRFLDLEITETILMEGSDESQKMLHDLHDLGINLSLDDFGTGYSSLAYLKRFPIDVIKIDKSFVHGCLEHPSDAAICEAIIDIAKRLGKRVVAEGVETREQCEYMKNNRCDVIQGFLFGRPAPASEINRIKSRDNVAVVD